jgi:uncharacterized protein (DUF58 family)
VTRAALPKLRAYPALAAVGLITAIALGRPELVALAAPFVLFLAAGLARIPAHDLRIEVALARDRILEGDEVELELRPASTSGVERLELRPHLPPRIEAVDPPPPTLRLAPGDERALFLRVRPTCFGGFPLGACEVRAFDRFGLTVDEAWLEPSVRLRAYPSVERLSRLLDPAETQPHAGNQVARAKGDGIEFADIRPFAPGDRVHRINWRASARRQAPQVNISHPERNTDVVIFLDTFEEVRRGDTGTLDQAVRAASALARGYLDRRDRVGVVGFGGAVHWLTPAGGRFQLYRIAEALIETQITASYAWKRMDAFPRGTLPPQSLVLALTPLLDERVLEALADLRGRGFDLAIIEVSPLAFVDPLPGPGGELAFRLWRLWRGALRYRYERLGIPVVEWHDQQPLIGALEEVRSFRRHARTLRV